MFKPDGSSTIFAVSPFAALSPEFDGYSRKSIGDSGVSPKAKEIGQSAVTGGNSFRKQQEAKFDSVLPSRYESTLHSSKDQLPSSGTATPAPAAREYAAISKEAPDPLSIEPGPLCLLGTSKRAENLPSKVKDADIEGALREKQFSSTVLLRPRVLRSPQADHGQGARRDCDRGS